MARGEDTGNHPKRRPDPGTHDPSWHGPLPTSGLSPEEHAAHREAMSKAATSGDLDALLMAHSAKIKASQPVKEGFTPEQEAGLRKGIADIVTKGGGETWGERPRKVGEGQGLRGHVYGRVR